MLEGVSILATGDEIVNGQIANSNGPFMAQKFWQLGIIPGMQLMVSDTDQDLVLGMQFLLSQHQIMLTIGGLGPTSDDRTRYALSAVLELELELHEPSWEAIQQRLSKRHIQISQTNRQQALFPKGSQVIANQNGSAPGCYIQKDRQHVFMLPGPPIECTTMFEQSVLPTIKAMGIDKTPYRQSWLLRGIPEARLGQEVEALPLPNSIRVGYRFDSPYIELKVNAEDADDLAIAIALVEPLIAEYLAVKDDEHR